jgi:hypothetical protein
MTSDPSIEHRFKRLENDRDPLYALVDDFRAETQARFDELDARLDRHDVRFDRVEAGLAEVLRRLPEPR